MVTATAASGAASAARNWKCVPTGIDRQVPGASHLARQPGLRRHLVVTVDPVTGLTGSHVEHARAWLDDLHR